MPKTMTLTCEAGHTWERESQRGRPPRWCPEHKPVSNPPASGKSSVQRMRQGRMRVTAENHALAIERVKAYRNWLTADAPLFGALRSGAITREEYHSKKPAMPAVPSDHDYAVAREAGAIQ